MEVQGLMMEKSGSISNESSSEEANHAANLSESTMDTAAEVILSESFAAAGQKNTGIGGKLSEANLLDERSLLACIVRTIPPGSGGRIRITTTVS